LNTSEVGNIRIGESNGNVRVVLDLSGKSIPEYRVDNVDGKITINIPTVAMTQVPTESVQQTFVEAPVVDMVETPVVEATVEETTSAEAAVAVDMTTASNQQQKNCC
jgi:hypothetical protein